MLLPKEIAGIANVASKDQARYGIRGVLIERVKGGKGRAVATDGKCLMVADFKDESSSLPDIEGFDPLIPASEEGQEFAAIVGVKALKDAAKAVKRNVYSTSTGIAIDEVSTNANGTISMAVVNRGDGVAKMATPEIEGPFPAYQEVIPAKGRGGVKFTLGARILSNLLKAAQGLSGDKDVAVTFELAPDDGVHSRPDNTAIRVDVNSKGNGIEITGVIMPVTLDS